MATELETTMNSNASGPKKAVIDGMTVEQHSLQDQIELDKYLASKKAVASSGLGIKLTKLSPHGMV